jgi:hypothetical protein
MDTRRIAHGNGQMRAQSISIQVSNRTRCNAGCFFCISRTTPGVQDQQTSRDIVLCNEQRLRVGLNYAKQLGATHAILTGRADPTQESEEYLCHLTKTAREYVPLVDMHTNGFLMHPGRTQAKLLERMVEAGLTMITFSIASFDDATNMGIMGIRQSAVNLIPIARDLGLLVRCSVVINRSGVASLADLVQTIREAGEHGAHMVVVREVWIPDSYGSVNTQVLRWNQENQIPLKHMQEEFAACADTTDFGYGIRQRTPLPWGTPVFTMSGVFKDPDHGVNVTFARCDEAADGDVLKSIVHRPDGHGYRNWDDRGDILY